MRVLLVRHGKAVDLEEAGTDAGRWLTADGREAMRAQAGRLIELGLRFDRVYTSPLVRAVQTAEILAAGNGFGGAIEARPALAPEIGTAAKALDGLDEVPDDGVVVLVGHMPRIRVLAGHLVAAPSFPPFRTGAACLIEWRPGQEGSFRFLLDPGGRRFEALSDVPV
jgi:phosphohistidine phosphatase